MKPACVWIVVYCDMMPCGLVACYQCFILSCCLHLCGLRRPQPKFSSW